MADDMLKWDVYEIYSTVEKLHGVKCRRRIRNYCIKRDINVLSDNATDKDNVVRYATLAGRDNGDLEGFLHGEFKELEIIKISSGIVNPVLSKWKINDGRD
jgi:hypothetical protein